jgi:hypothetical protein
MNKTSTYLVNESVRKTEKDTYNFSSSSDFLAQAVGYKPLPVFLSWQNYFRLPHQDSRRSSSIT